MSKETRRKQFAYFNRSIVPALRDYTGFSYEEARDYLYATFALIDNDNLEVESMADMTTERLFEFVNDCKRFVESKIGALIPEKGYKGTKFLNE